MIRRNAKSFRKLDFVFLPAFGLLWRGENRFDNEGGIILDLTSLNFVAEQYIIIYSNPVTPQKSNHTICSPRYHTPRQHRRETISSDFLWRPFVITSTAWASLLFLQRHWIAHAKTLSDNKLVKSLPHEHFDLPYWNDSCSTAFHKLDVRCGYITAELTWVFTIEVVRLLQTQNTDNRVVVDWHGIK